MNQPPTEEGADPQEFNRERLRQTARRGVTWIVWSRVALQLLSIGITITLAHLLDPVSFGLFGLAYVLVQLVNYVDGFRVEAALVQTESTDEHALSSAFVFSVLLSLLFFLVAWMAGPTIASIFATPELAPVLQVSSLVFVTRATSSTHRALLKRALRFGAISAIQMSAIIVGGAVAVVLALLGYGVWALVWYFVIREAVSAAATIVLSKWRPRVRPSVAALKPILRFGAPSAASEMSLYFQYYMADLVVGRALGTVSLGLFQQGQALATRPSSIAADVVGKLAFPIFSRAQARGDQVRSGYLFTVSTVATALVPVAASVLLFAPELVRILYGSHWNAAVPVVQVLAPMAAFRVLQPLTSSIFHAHARTGLELRINLAVVLLFAVLLLVGLPFGLFGVCVATLASFIVQAGVSQHYVNGILEIRWRQLFQRTWVPVAGTAAMVFVVYLGGALSFTGSGLSRLVGLGGAGFVAYLAVVHGFDRTILKSVLMWIGLRRDVRSSP